MPISKLACVLVFAAAAYLCAAPAHRVEAAPASPVSLDEFAVRLNVEGIAKAPAAQDDYYLHVNYSWLKDHKIPATESEYSSFMAARDRVKERLAAITRDCVKNRAHYQDAGDEAKIADLRGCISDFKSRNRAGFGGLSKPLAEIEKVSSLKDYALLMARLGREYGFGALVGGYSIGSEPIKADRYVVYIDEPSLGLGKEFLAEPRNEKYFQLYRDYMRDLLVLYGRPQSEAEREAKEFFALQQDLAAHSMSIGDLYNPSKSTHKLSLQELEALYSNFDVPAMLKEAQIGPENGVSSWYVSDPNLIRRFNELFTPDRLPLFKDFAICEMLRQNAVLLTKQYSDLAYEHGRKMSGAPKLKSASKRADELCQGLLDLNYGRLYAKKYFSEQSRSEVRSYISLVMDEYRKKLTNLDWMDAATRKQALKKLDTMVVRIGYPDKWPDYVDKYRVVRKEDGGVLIDNVLAMQALQWQRLKDRIGKPVDRTEWTLPPQTVNAFYRRADNSINFPAGILQPPFFDPKADRETNLGGVGMVIAHEMTHSFDSNGSQYDETGALRDWWTAEDKREFQSRQAGIVRFYGRYRIQEGVYQNGEQTISENIADLGAMSCLTDIVGDDLEGLKRVYTNYAKIWAWLMRDSSVRFQLTNVHAFPCVRVDAVLSSTDGFYRAYGVKPGDGMYVKPEDRARLW
jgi:putative endopeptidase